ncbi:MAG: SET domain-containing protein-lysine N-methyltransferase [Verrucomicrobiaceae bacterium]
MSVNAEPKHYEIRGSAIHGRGLYAASFIPKETWIVEYVGEKVNKEESDRRSNELLDKTKENGGARVYTFILNDEWDIDGEVESNEARLMNHSCEPNVEAQVWDEKEIWFVALRDIEKGEELTFNYGFDLDNWQEHPCRCGAERCPGYIADEEMWPQLRRKIAGRKGWENRRLKVDAPSPVSGVNGVNTLNGIA